jgi:hypothetical protein
MPILLKVRHISPQVLLHYCVHPLGLTVGLGVEGSTQSTVNTKSVTDSFPEGGGELWASIGYNTVGQTMESEDVENEQVCQVVGINITTARDQVASFRESVDYY